ncbi:cytochrome c [Halomonas mongoliensis]|jgi:mono/diheme cytochrome c family protein|uniref:Cytochrome c n=1 Tax=Halomonas mongoliensis TaxID=321265 RepID=A0ABU1GQL0_9GAMM|nr:cytochrome c [Halomonas mongoliensis]MDR5894304.1 cytochrome c [Halomonas mongoliensis]
MQHTTTLPPRHLSAYRLGALALFGALLLPTMASASEPEAREPAEVYRQVCAHCHATDKAVGPVITNAFPEAAQESWGTYIQLTVRNGRAAMPAFRHSEISDAELKALSAALARGELAEDDGGEE